MDTIILQAKQFSRELHKQQGDKPHKITDWDDGMAFSALCPFSGDKEWEVVPGVDPEKGNYSGDDFCGACNQMLFDHDEVDARAELDYDLSQEK